MSKDDINLDKVADLAKIALSDDMKSKLQTELNSFLNMLKTMHELNTDEVQPLAHSIDINQPLRTDISVDNIDRDNLQSQAPSTQQYLYTVPQFIEEK